MKFILIGALLLTGCATLPPPIATDPSSYRAHLQTISTIQHFELDGRIAVLTEKRGFSGGLRWQHRSDGDEMAFLSPLGTQLGQLSSDAEGVTLTTSSQKVLHAQDAETLTRDNLGWSLPLKGLPDWVLGRPSAGAATILAWDEIGHITHLQQNGWDIHYENYQWNEGRDLPSKITLKSPKLDLKLVIDHWLTDAD